MERTNDRAKLVQGEGGGLEFGLELIGFRLCLHGERRAGVLDVLEQPFLELSAAISFSK